MQYAVDLTRPVQLGTTEQPKSMTGFLLVLGGAAVLGLLGVAYLERSQGARLRARR